MTFTLTFYVCSLLLFSDQLVKEEGMSSHPSVQHLENLLTNFIDNLHLAISKLKEEDGSRLPSPDFNLTNFWAKMEASFAILSRDSTSLMMMFSKPPTPTTDECQGILQKLEVATLSIVSTFYSLSKEYGVTFRKNTRQAVVNITEALVSLVTRIRREGSNGLSAQTQATGNIWECCDAFQSLPKDNKEAVLKLAQDTSSLVNDALQELEMAREIEGDDNGLDDFLGQESSNENSWSERDLEVLAPCLGLVKTTRSCIKKVMATVRVKGHSNSPKRASELDDLADLLHQVSPATDDFVLSLYPPLRYSAVKANGEDLAVVLRNLLETTKASHTCSEEDSPWISFLQNATDHNLDKLRQKTQNTPS